MEGSFITIQGMAAELSGSEGETDESDCGQLSKVSDFCNRQELFSKIWRIRLFLIFITDIFVVKVFN